jgi:hypothetical protein
MRDVCVGGVSPPCEPNTNMDDCCGDGVLDANEECDLGPWHNNDMGECTTFCKLAACGDGFIYNPFEACDGEEYCADDCTFSTCGDGVVQLHEWCEKTRPDDPECTDFCLDSRKVIFVTSEHYVGGELGGVAGADEKCQMLADDAGLGGEFMAWLATSHDDSPLLRFNWLNGPYVDVNGQQLAATWSEVYQTYGNLPPNITEMGVVSEPSEILWPWMFPQPTYKVAWASPIGGPDFGDGFGLCGGWNDPADTGSAALLDHNPDIPNNASKWFSVNWYKADCSLSAPIICVEQ